MVASFGTLFTCFLQGLSLLRFRAIVDYDPHNALGKWDTQPCMWTRFYCEDGKVQLLIFFKSHFFGAMPKEFGGLAKLELLDLSGSSLNGVIPSDIGGKVSLKRLLLSDNKFEGHIPLELKRLRLLYDVNKIYAVFSGISCINRKFGNCIWPSSSRKLNMADSTVVPIKEILIYYLTALPLPLFKVTKTSRHGCCLDVDVSSSSEPHVIQNVQNLVTSVRHRLLSESNNIPPVPPPSTASQLFSVLYNIIATRKSVLGFPAVYNVEKASGAPPPSTRNNTSNTSPPVYQSMQRRTAENTSGTKKYFILFIMLGLFFVIGAITVIMCGRCRMTAVGPWKTGLSGQLQKAFVTGVPNLKLSEIETSCEGFSNIVYDSCTGYIIYKGTLSDGLEIAVVSIRVRSHKDWSDNAEKAFREKIDTLSRVNHKNFVNLIGYCEENDPFTRMMVYEYAPNGTLFEYLHVKGYDHLDWSARMRIIMGTAYCLEYIHHDVNPPVAVCHLNSLTVGLTEDFAAKVADVLMSPELKLECMEEDPSESHSFERQTLVDIETNIYKFGVLLLEVISGKLQYSEEQGTLMDWAAQYLSQQKSLSSMVDPTLKSHKDNELEVICEVVQDIIEADPTQRPTMKEIVTKLCQGLSISPEQAIPRLSPLWWAELELLSMEVA